MKTDAYRSQPTFRETTIKTRTRTERRRRKENAEAKKNPPSLHDESQERKENGNRKMKTLKRVEFVEDIQSGGKKEERKPEMKLGGRVYTLRSRRRVGDRPLW